MKRVTILVAFCTLLSGCMYEREDDNPKDTLHKRSPKVKQIELTTKGVGEPINTENTTYIFHYENDVLTSYEYDGTATSYWGEWTEHFAGTCEFEYGNDYYSVIRNVIGNELCRLTYYPDEGAVKATVGAALWWKYYYEGEKVVSSSSGIGQNVDYTWANGNITKVSSPTTGRYMTIQYTNYDYDTSIDYIVEGLWVGLGVIHTPLVNFALAPLNSGFKTSKLPSSCTMVANGVAGMWANLSYDFNRDNLVSKVKIVVTGLYENPDNHYFKGTAWTTNLTISYY